MSSSTSSPASKESDNAPRTVLITGASAGIGLAFAKVFAQKGWNLILTARREERLQSLSEQLSKEYNVHVSYVVADLAEHGAPQKIFDELTEKNISVDGLINNAGYGVPGNFTTTDWTAQRDFLQVQITAASELCHLFMAGMKERHFGRIINVSSINGILPSSTGQTLYAGAKAYLIAMSQTLQSEEYENNIHVCAVCPGFTYTEFHDVTGTRERAHQSYPPFMWMDADTVARQGYEAVMRGDYVCINGWVNKGIALLVKILPRTLALRIINGGSKKYRKQDASDA